MDNLRKENVAALEALNSAQSIAQQRVLERDSYFLTVEELEQSFQKLQEKYTAVCSAKYSTTIIDMSHNYRINMPTQVTLPMKLFLFQG